MSAGVHHLLMEEGSIFCRIIRYETGAGNPVDLTGWNARMHIKKEVDSDVILYELTTENGRLKINGEKGEIVMNLTVEEVKNPAEPFGSGVWALEIFPNIDAPETDVEQLLKGRVRYEKETVR